MLFSIDFWYMFYLNIIYDNIYMYKLKKAKKWNRENETFAMFFFWFASLTLQELVFLLLSKSWSQSSWSAVLSMFHFLMCKNSRWCVCFFVFTFCWIWFNWFCTIGLTPPLFLSISIIVIVFFKFSSSLIISFPLSKSFIS